MDEVRRNRQSIAEGLKESGDAMKASTDRLAAIQMAMDAVKSLNNKELFNKLPRHRQVGGSTVGDRSIDRSIASALASPPARCAC